MADMTEDQMWNMSDEELEAAFSNAKADFDSPETGVEEEMTNELVDEDVELTTDEEDLEQPLEDSDDDLDMDATEEETLSEDSETEEEVTDEASEDDEEQTEEEDDTAEEEVLEVQEHVFKANGKEYKFTQEEILKQFPRIFGQAMDYTKKTQAIKPWRKTIDALESAELSHDDVSLMIDVLKGDKDAIAEVVKRTGVDALDLDTENSRYVPKNYGRDDNALAVKDIVDEISVDKEFETTQRILSKDWDETSFNAMTQDPEMIRLLHVDVKSGMYDKVQPIAEKLKVFDRGRKSDLDYYKDAAAQYFQEEAQTQQRAERAEQARLDREAKLARQAEVERVKATQAKQRAAKVEAPRRKAAAPTKSNAGTKGSINYLDDSDEAFEEWYQNNVVDKY